MLYIPKELQVQVIHYFVQYGYVGMYTVCWYSYDSANIAAVVAAFTLAWRRNYYVRKEGVK